MPRVAVPCERSSDPCKHRQALGEPSRACCSLTTASLNDNPPASTYRCFVAAESLPPAYLSVAAVAASQSQKAAVSQLVHAPTPQHLSPGHSSAAAAPAYSCPGTLHPACLPPFRPFPPPNFHLPSTPEALSRPPYNPRLAFCFAKLPVSVFCFVNMPVTVSCLLELPLSVACHAPVGSPPAGGWQYCPSSTASRSRNCGTSCMTSRTLASGPLRSG